MSQRQKTFHLPGCHPFSLLFNDYHWRPNGTSHGPKSNPRIASVYGCRLHKYENALFLGWRLWIYIRGGYACYFDFYVNRRPK